MVLATTENRLFLQFAAGSAGDQGSHLLIFCLIDLASCVTRVKNVQRRPNIWRGGAMASDVLRGGPPQSRYDEGDKTDNGEKRNERPLHNTCSECNKTNIDEKRVHPGGASTQTISYFAPQLGQ
jgi:hypothetical protein